MNLRQLFLHHVAQTSVAPIALEIESAEGCTITDTSGKKFIDLIGGISVAHVGHRHPRVTEAIKNQVDRYMHVMVYGEFIQAPQVRYATLLTDHLPHTLDSVYFTNSGAEAIEGAMKLAKRVTGRTGIIGFEQSYHGSTQGALSIIGSEYWRNAFRPLLPGIEHLRYNSIEDLAQITEQTAAVFTETIQAESGVRAPSAEWLQALRQKCSDTGCLLVMDEIQAGFGRTGKLWGFEHFNIIPDIIVLGKALGGGMPLGAFIAGKDLMDHLVSNPVLGHITTFGGHPVCCAAGMEAFHVMLEEELIQQAQAKEQLFKSLLIHPAIREIRSFGLWMSLEFEHFERCKQVIDGCLREGFITDWFLFAPNCLRISPPLTISEAEIRSACASLVKCMK
jgi:acetylornithine/N-succinyldiaminopimelate aminotransferase